MNAISSSDDTGSLLRIVRAHYPLRASRLSLHRDMIGWVYLVEGAGMRYVLKCYRPFDSENALRAIDLMTFLQQQGYPVAAIVPTRAGGTHMLIETPAGRCIAILFNYLPGPEPDRDAEITALGQQVGWLHRLMECYPNPLPSRGQEFYIDRYLTILQQLNYPARRIDDLADYGRECWSRIRRLPAGFCHGDLHTGNMRQSAPGRYALFDFDAASRTHSVIDIATLCDSSNFNLFDSGAYERTLQTFERFYQGYREEREIGGAEFAAIFDFIPIRHYEIIATITQCQGFQVLSRAFLDEQYDWLLRWSDLCQQKRQTENTVAHHLRGGLT